MVGAAAANAQGAASQVHGTFVYEEDVGLNGTADVVGLSDGAGVVNHGVGPGKGRGGRQLQEGSGQEAESGIRDAQPAGRNQTPMNVERASEGAVATNGNPQSSP